MLEDSRDQEIMRILSENPDGITRISLFNQVKHFPMAKRTFDLHLKYLIENGLIEKIKNLNKGPNSKTILKANVSEEEKKSIRKYLELEDYIEYILNSKLSKKTKIAASSFYIFQLSTQFIMPIGSLVFEDRRLWEYQLGLAIIKDQILKFKKILKSHFNKDELERIAIEALHLDVLIFESNLIKMSHILETTKKIRSAEEISFDFAYPSIDDLRNTKDSNKDLVVDGIIPNQLSSNSFFKQKSKIYGISDSEYQIGLKNDYVKMSNNIHLANKKFTDAIKNLKIHHFHSLEEEEKQNRIVQEIKEKISTHIKQFV